MVVGQERGPLVQVSCAVSRHPAEGKFELRQNVPAVMTVNGFQEGEGGGEPASCDGQYHSDDEFVVSLSSEWYAGGARCGRTIRIVDTFNIGINVKVVDECAGCDNETRLDSKFPHTRRNVRGGLREGTVDKMTQKLEGFMDNKEEACVNRHDIKEEKKAGRFDIFMAVTDKKINLGNQKTKLEEKKNQTQRE
nr:putative ripening-related protein 6 [Triticum aestivum]